MGKCIFKSDLSEICCQGRIKIIGFYRCSDWASSPSQQDGRRTSTAAASQSEDGMAALRLLISVSETWVEAFRLFAFGKTVAEIRLNDADVVQCIYKYSCCHRAGCRGWKDYSIHLP